MLAEIASAITMLGCVTSAAVCTRLMLRQMRELIALEDENARLRAENEAYARTVVASVLRGRGPRR